MMKKLILGTVLATVAGTSAMADNNKLSLSECLDLDEFINEFSDLTDPTRQGYSEKDKLTLKRVAADFQKLYDSECQ